MLSLEIGDEFLPVRHDRDDLSALGRDLLVRLRERVDVDAAVGTPMPAMEGYCHRSPPQELFELNHVPGVVGENEGRHRLAKLWRRIANAILAESFDQTVDRRGEIGLPLSGGIGERTQLLAQ